MQRAVWQGSLAVEGAVRTSVWCIARRAVVGASADLTSARMSRRRVAAVVPLPFESEPARILFDAILLIFVAGELAIRFVSFHNSGRDRELGSLIVVVAGLGISLAGALLAAVRVQAAAIPFARVPVFVLGLLVIAFGIVLRLWSVAVLGRYFTVTVQVSENQPVVDRGPYRMLRHPSYSGLLCVCLGFGIALGNWLAIIVAVAPALAAVVVRIRVEERMLLTAIGHALSRVLCNTFPAAPARLVTRKDT